MDELSVQKHHVRQEFCQTRPKYREGRKLKAVKVYTVSKESKYLLVQGVPALGAAGDFVKLFALCGAIQEYRILDDYPGAEEFMEVYLVKFEKISSARAAKRKLDDYSFFGGCLHVCYAPEFETVEETRQKLQDRRKSVASRIRDLEKEGVLPSHSKEISIDENAYLKSSISQSNDQTLDPHQSYVHQNPYSEYPSDKSQHGSEHAFPQVVLNAQTFINSKQQYEQQQKAEQEMPYSNFIPIRLPPPPQQNTSWKQSRRSRLNMPHDTPMGSSLPGFEPLRQFHSVNSNSSHDISVHADIKNKQFAAIRNEHQTKLIDPINQSNKTNINTAGASSKTSKVADERIMNGVVIREHKVTKTSTPKFVPRQTQTLFKKNADSLKNVVKSEAEKLNAKIRQNACILGDVKGPTLLDEKKDEVTANKMLDCSVQETVREIRGKLKAFSSVEALTPPSKKKRKT